MGGYQYRSRQRVEDTSTDDRRLTEHEREILIFELGWQTGQGTDKRTAIRDRFKCSASTYYTELDRIVELDAAARFAPALVRRRRARSAPRTLAG